VTKDKPVLLLVQHDGDSTSIALPADVQSKSGDEGRGEEDVVRARCEHDERWAPCLKKLDDSGSPKTDRRLPHRQRQRN